MRSIYLEDWKDSKKEGLINDFEINKLILEGAEILLAYYSYQCYEGYAFVLFEKDGHLFEVHGSHCSCYGLEGQWEPEETTIESIEHRIKEGNLGTGYRSYKKEDIFSNDLIKILKKLKKELNK